MIYTHIRITDTDDHIVRIEPVATRAVPQWATGVAQTPFQWPGSADFEKPCFAPPIAFVHPPTPGSGEPFYSHNHCPSITYCDNGDLLAAWFSTQREDGTEMTILASRLRAGKNRWEPASEFFNADARNMTGTALFNDGNGTLYHFNGVGQEHAVGWEHLALLLRTSVDNGVTWTTPCPISSGAHYQHRHQVISGTSITPKGIWLQPCDGTHAGIGPSVLHISRDQGRTWQDPGGEIRGIHAGVAGLRNGRLLAFGRAQAIDGKMPISVSDNDGKTWEYRASPFPPISAGQRLVLMCLHEGPLLLVSFTGPTHKVDRKNWPGMPFVDHEGKSFTGFGLFAALSFDEAETWPIHKLLTPGSGEHDGGAWTGKFTTGPEEAEPQGYLAATQTPDRIIHLISSRLHYRFNLSWLTL